MTDVSDTVHVDALLSSLDRVGKTVEAITKAAAPLNNAAPLAPPAGSPLAGGNSP